MRSLLTLLMLAAPALASADEIGVREGWRVEATDLGYAALLAKLIAAVPQEGMGVVTEAGPTEAARARGVEIPGNRVVGVFNNVYAVRILGLSAAAMIEAPVRFYVTEGVDETATLSWKTPSFVFAPYVEEAGPDLAAAATELDGKFEAIAARTLAD